MQWLDAMLLGVIQGITEFLPISSSGHLWLVEQFVLHQPANLPFIALLHLASLLTIILVLRKKLIILTQSLFKHENNDPFYNRQLAWQLLLATSITAIVGLTLRNFIQHEMDRTILLVSLVITSIIIFGSTLGKPRIKIQNCSWFIMSFLGVIQGLAVFPGISRSGVTIGFLLLIGLPKERAVDISFLLSIPAILGACLILLPEALSSASSTLTVEMMVTASLTTFIFSYIMISLLRKSLDKIWFLCGVWCLLLAGGLWFV